MSSKLTSRNSLAIVTKEEIAAVLNIRSYTYLGCHLAWIFVLLLWVTDDQLLLFMTCGAFPAPSVFSGVCNPKHEWRACCFSQVALEALGENKSPENDRDK